MKPLGGFGLPTGFTALPYLESPSDPNAYVESYFRVPLPRICSNYDSILYETEHMFTNYGTSLQGEGIVENFITFFIGNNNSQAGKYVAIDGVLYGGAYFPNINEKFTCSNGEWHTIRHYLGNEQNPKWQLSIDGELKVNVSNLQFDPEEHYKTYFCVFGTNGGHALCGKKRTAKIWVNGELLYDLVPVLDDTGTPGFYDRKNREMYYNDGAGDFLFPSPVTTYSLRRVAQYVPEFAQLTPRGVRRLYRVPAGYAGSVAEYAAEHGFKRLVATAPPANGYWSSEWRETETELRLVWQEMPQPLEEEFLIE